jgi:hypothetical protein
MTEPATFTFQDPADDGETSALERDGFTLKATIYRDDDTTPPWKRHDGHGPVSDWRPCDSKRAGELVLSQDGRSCRFYDFAGAVEIAKRDEWGGGSPPEGATKGQIAEAAARADFENLRAWCADEWFWCGVAVTVSKAGVQLTGQYDNALWGIENTAGAYLAEVAEELASEALPAARAKLAELTA